MHSGIERLLEREREEARMLLREGFVPREESIKDVVGKRIAKIITGPRRAGKSIFALQSIQNLNYAYANFDDESLLRLISENYNDLMKALAAVYGNFSVMLLDEIQNLPNWQLFVNRLERQGYNPIITGSNSKMMSSELATHLTGRYIDKLILPFSFSEYLAAKTADTHASKYEQEKEGAAMLQLKKYMESCGYPEVVAKGLESTNYIRLLVDNTIYNDIVRRHKLRKQDDMHALLSYLLDLYAKEFTYDSAAKALSINSANTIKKYAGYLEEAYLVFYVKRLEVKAGLRQKAPRKVYAIDPGLVNTFSTRLGRDYGRGMENVVAIELLRRGEKFFYWKSSTGKEVDFVTTKGIKVERLIQVCYDIEDNSVRKREISALLNAGETLRCPEMLVITWDYEAEEEIGGRRIGFVPLWKWLLNREGEDNSRNDVGLAR